LQKIIAIRFDLSKPLQHQILVAQETLEIEAKELGVQFPRPQLSGKTRKTWPRHLRVIDAKDQGATHEEIYEQFVEEWSDGDESIEDQYFRKTRENDDGSKPRAIVSQWHKQAVEVMEKVSYLL